MSNKNHKSSDDERQLSLLPESPFDRIRHVDDNGVEHWTGRELQPLLEYGTWRKFNGAIERAKLACENSGNSTARHFAPSGKKVSLGSGVTREIEDYRLTRYACYLIAMNSDPRKEAV